MEIEPEILPPEDTTRRRRRMEYKWTVKRVHPVVGVLLAIGGLALFVLLFVTFVWVALIAAAVAAVGVAARALLSFFRPAPPSRQPKEWNRRG